MSTYDLEDLYGPTMSPASSKVDMQRFELRKVMTYKVNGRSRSKSVGETIVGTGSPSIGEMGVDSASYVEGRIRSQSFNEHERERATFHRTNSMFLERRTKQKSLNDIQARYEMREFSESVKSLGLKRDLESHHAALIENEFSAEVGIMNFTELSFMLMVCLVHAVWFYNYKSEPNYLTYSYTALFTFYCILMLVSGGIHHREVILGGNSISQFVLMSRPSDTFNRSFSAIISDRGSSVSKGAILACTVTFFLSLMRIGQMKHRYLLLLAQYSFITAIFTEIDVKNINAYGNRGLYNSLHKFLISTYILLSNVHHFMYSDGRKIGICVVVDCLLLTYTVLYFNIERARRILCLSRKNMMIISVSIELVGMLLLSMNNSLV